MLILDQMAEDRINEAIARGEFDDLPGQGHPLILDALTHVPEEMRMAHKIMKNADIKPPMLELRKEIIQQHQSLTADKNTESRTKTLKKIQCLLIKLDMNGHSHSSIPLQQAYYKNLIGRLSRNP